jgi:chemotaxis signal transduction protein
MTAENHERQGQLLFDREVSPEQLEQWTALTASTKPVRPVGLTGALLFRAGDEWLALPAGVLDEALDMRPIHAVPYLSNPVFIGLVNAGGELLPCIGLARLMQSPQVLSAVKPRILCVRLTQGRFALMADEVVGACRYDPAEVSPPPDTVAKGPRPLVMGMVKLEGRLAGLLDPRALGAALLGSLRP